MTKEDGNWQWPLFEQFLLLNILLKIATKKCPAQLFGMDVGWSLCDDRRFTVKSAYDFCVGYPTNSREEVWAMINIYRGLSKIKMLLWIIGNDRLLTTAERLRCHLTTNSSCLLCAAPEEDIYHLLSLSICTFHIGGVGETREATSFYIYGLESLDNYESQQFQRFFEDALSIIEQSKSLMEITIQASTIRLQQTGQKSRGPARVNVWKRPPSGWLKMNSDGARHKEPGLTLRGGDPDGK
ncbi:uncharacterized protein LOC120121727 [Hibiscus syriacus]|uniref:uncharacterized protein LOC120121727 n=1 Tax=Hibiscus syriacus TaxID=106335 RepID=UPI0019211AD6|nr:uncharacterized protein LOC120121727 [Hibiscus syriacus]